MCFCLRLRREHDPVIARQEQAGQRIQIEHKAHRRFRLTEISCQVVVASAAANSRSRALDIDLEGESGVIVEPRYIAEVDLEVIRKAERFNDAPQIIEAIKRGAGSRVRDNAARSVESFELARKPNELRKGPTVVHGRMRTEKALQVNCVAP